MNVDHLTLTGAAEQIERGELSPLELTEAFLQRIQKINPTVNAFITVTEQEALRNARQAEMEIRKGNYRGALHGIPVAIKDIFETADVRTTAGSKILAEYVPSADATAVARLYQNGAIIIGKANLHEWALGVTNDNPHFGATRNPWSLERIPGGSSGGSAAALSAHMCLGALGTDTGGSIRIPASACGVVGIKPTYGLVSLKGVFPLSWSLDHAGPMALTVRDLATLLDAISGYDEDDPVSAQNAKDRGYASALDNQDIEQLRIAAPKDYFFERVDRDVENAVRNAIRAFEKLGAFVSEQDYANLKGDAGTSRIIALSEAGVIHHQHVLERKSEIGEDVLAPLGIGLKTSLDDYVRARRIQIEKRREYIRFFRNVDILLTPTLPVEPPTREGLDPVKTNVTLIGLTAPFNLTGLPAISLPCGFTSRGLPIGMQLVATHWNEQVLFRAANAFENATDWHKRKPSAWNKRQERSRPALN
jgi:aspartyl-tRNA(Asn)/glutamyl-tRNA(Gln) amidotransferase subunit A